MVYLLSKDSNEDKEIQAPGFSAISLQHNKRNCQPDLIFSNKKEYSTQNCTTKFQIAQQSLEKLFFSTQLISPQKASNKSESEQPGLPEARKIGTHFNTRLASEPAANPKAARRSTVAGAVENLSPLMAGTVMSQCASRFFRQLVTKEAEWPVGAGESRSRSSPRHTSQVI